MAECRERLALPLRGLASSAASARWLRQLSGAPELQPLSLAGTRLGGVLAGSCVAGIAVIAGLEVWQPGLASLGSLLFIPVLASSWLIGGYLALTVSTLAVAARLLGYTSAGVDIGTAVAEVMTLAALATMTRAAALGLAEGRARSARVARERRAHELFEQRERIAQDVTATAVKTLFSVTLRLQAAGARTQDASVEPALDQAISELDELTSELRRLVFADAQTAPTALDAAGGEADQA